MLKTRIKFKIKYKLSIVIINVRDKYKYKPSIKLVKFIINTIYIVNKILSKKKNSGIKNEKIVYSDGK